MNPLSNSCLDNHRCFRVLLQAMSRPGQIFKLADSTTDEFETSLLRLLDAVLDQQSTCHLIDDNPELQDKIKELTSTRFSTVEAADFILAQSGSSRGKTVLAKRGRLDFPDEGATILFGVDKLMDGGAAAGCKLTGPGIKNAIYPHIIGLNGDELSQLKAVNGEFPLGVDSIFLDHSGQVMCIPRSTRIGG